MAPKGGYLPLVEINLGGEITPGLLQWERVLFELQFVITVFQDFTQSEDQRHLDNC